MNIAEAKILFTRELDIIKALKKKGIRNIIRQQIHNMERPDYNGWGICEDI